MILIHILDRTGELPPVMFSLEDESIEKLSPSLITRMLTSPSAPRELDVEGVRTDKKVGYSFAITSCKTCAHLSGTKYDILLSVV